MKKIALFALALILGIVAAIVFWQRGGGDGDSTESPNGSSSSETSSTSGGDDNADADNPYRVAFNEFGGDEMVEATDPVAASIEATRLAYASATIAVVSTTDEINANVDLAQQAGVPLILSDGRPEVAAELDRLGVTTLVSQGTVPADWAGEVLATLPEIATNVVDAPVVVTDRNPQELTSLANAGATFVPADTLSDSAETMALVDGVPVVGISSDPSLQWMVDAARTGVELPGGGQHVFGNKRYVALYGSPVTETLGVLGEQDVPATIERAAATAAEYDELTDETVIPTLEIIVTVASGSPGSDGNYSNEWPIETMAPLVEAAGEAGQYVVLDFQSGRSDFLSQIKMYEELIALPYVGIALDPEWRLEPDEVPLTRIGHVEIDEVNEVVTYLADFVAERDLPQKMIVLHQFQVQMLRDIDQLDQSRSEVAILIHADGQGSQGAKNSTWQTLLANAPHVEYWGWKNFYDEDTPMLNPAQTMAVEPMPHFISYQ